MRRTAFVFVLLACVLLAGFGLPVNAETIPLQRAQGTLLVAVRINGKITLEFVLDTGASDVSIPADVASTLVRTGTITSADLIGTERYQMADGSTSTRQEIRIHSLRIGDTEITDVVASIAPAQGPMLLGQSFLSRLPSWAIDNERGVLIIGTSSQTPPRQQAETLGSEAGEQAPEGEASASAAGEQAHVAGDFAQEVASIQNVFWKACGSDPTATPVSVCGPLSALVGKAQSLLNEVQTGVLSEQDAERQLKAIRDHAHAVGVFADEVASIQGVFLGSCGSDSTANPVSVCGPLGTLATKAQSLLNEVQAGALSQHDAEQQLEMARDQAGHSP